VARPLTNGRKMEENMTSLVCSFCGSDQRLIEKLIAGPRVYICNHCVRSALGSPESVGARSWTSAASDQRCCFCSKVHPTPPGRAHESRLMVCDSCLRTCAEIFASDHVGPTAPTSGVRWLRRLLGGFKWLKNRITRWWLFTEPADENVATIS
jgi:hypothetical protein